MADGGGNRWNHDSGGETRHLPSWFRFCSVRHNEIRGLVRFKLGSVQAWSNSVKPESTRVSWSNPSQRQSTVGSTDGQRQSTKDPECLSCTLASSHSWNDITESR
ncbi:hypothetical protein Hdeb2414_s0007g00247231 [Helianthus debilis subsp. tardiflorus]